MAPVDDLCPPVPRLGGVAGFRHFLASTRRAPFVPRNTDLTMIDGELPQQSHDSEQRFRQRMAHLARRLNSEADWTRPLAAGLKMWENPGIPAGYTYFLQLIAHDLIESGVPVSESGDPLTTNGNLRRAPLVLETLYGGGPMQSPLAYRAEPDRSPRRYLRLGPMMMRGDGVAPYRDIARVSAFPDFAGAPMFKPEGAGSGCPFGRTEALIADPRNDENANLSQLLVAFSLLHNCIVARLEKTDLKDHADSADEADFDRFLCARTIVSLIYRHVIRNDVLPRILHPEVLRAYQGPNPTFIDKDMAAGDLRPTLEFAHAAFRFGHSMVRDAYSFSHGRVAENTEGFELAHIMRQSSGGNAPHLPADDRWIASWSRFFEFKDLARPDFSRRIGPCSATALADAVAFGKPHPKGEHGVDYRDLISAGLVRLWRLDPLIERLGGATPGLMARSELLSDRRLRHDAVRTWLSRNNSDPDSPDIGALAADPPLPFFIRFEAAWGGRGGGGEGRHLGLLGSIIVAETIYGALVHATLPAEDSAKRLSEMIKDTICAQLGPKALAVLPELTGETEIDTMPKLLATIPKLYGGRLPGPAFL
ncbi:peroxidase family protein [Phreatobacter stygius]|uniref:peroxidase family protein n=1 Tax=Phreatobacter stygius TaxID=1940610 RepID=UPI0014768274|nr:peroxidase family protein [Phreatobacter stygius]